MCVVEGKGSLVQVKYAHTQIKLVFDEVKFQETKTVVLTSKNNVK